MRNPPRAVRWLLALLVLRRLRHGHGKPPEPPYGTEPSPETEAAAGAGREVGADPRAELGVAAALLAAGALGAAFCVIYAFDGSNTQLLGLSFGLGLLAVAAALILAARRVFPRETAVEPRPVLAERRRGAEEEVSGELGAAADGVSRRGLLKGAAGAAGVGLGAAAIVPLVSLGPNVGRTIDTTPWHRGVVLVDEAGAPIRAEDVIEGSFATAFPAGADMRLLGSPVVVVRVPPAMLRLPPGRAGWAPEGLLAFSKICTHAGCAIALYRSPLDQQTSRQSPALVCPCHYSTFEVSTGATVQFGPAGRPLPQLPLAVRADRVLVAGGGFSGPVGPSWWDVDREGPTA
ncbi:MAG: ubiquinol-cytochrome c reductase iron-sulfur subunit [Solirubrobacteraceae bacterium]